MGTPDYLCRMYILLVAATPFEIQPTVDFLAKTEYRLGRHSVELLLSGVGSLSTAYLLTYNLNLHQPDLVIQAGIAGTFTDLPIGSVVAVREEILGDLGVWEENRFNTIFDMKLADADAAPFSEGRLINPHEELFELAGLEEARAVTVNEITSSPQRVDWYKHNGSPVVESMEGGALHYVCLQEQIPFLQIRSVSNQVGDRNKANWNIPAAIAGLNEKLIELLTAIEPLDT